MSAIRAKDMEKGIFTTVSQLPEQEPRKAALPVSAGAHGGADERQKNLAFIFRYGVTMVRASHLPGN